MKKIICITVSVVMALLVLTACAGKNSDSRVLDFYGEKVKVTVDLSDGWEDEWGDYVCYLYPGKNDGNLEAAGWGVYMSADDFAVHYTEITDTYADAYSNVQLFTDGSLKCESVSDDGEYATAYYYKKISDSSYLQIVSQDVPGDELFDRFTVKVVK